MKGEKCEWNGGDLSRNKSGDAVKYQMEVDPINQAKNLGLF